MARSTILPAASLALLLAAGSPAAAQTPAEPSIDVQRLYQLHCQACHTADGNSPVAMLNFVDGEWKHGSSVKEISVVIRDGLAGTAMIPFDGKLTQPEIEALARYVRAFDKNLQPEEAETKDGKKKKQQKKKKTK